MIGLHALQYQDFRFWYHRIEKRAVVNRDQEAEATLLLLQASEKLIYWKEPESAVDSLLEIALNKTDDDSLIAAIQLRRADFLIGSHQFEEAEQRLSQTEFLLIPALESERVYLKLRAGALNFDVLKLQGVVDSLKLAQVSQDVLLKFQAKAGDIAYNQGYFDWSAFFYREALKVCKSMGWDGFKARLLVDLADVCLIHDQLDSVNYYVEQSNEILLKNPSPITACNGFGLAGRAQLKLGEIALARNNFQTLLQTAIQINSPNNQLKAYLGLSEVALKSRQWHLADSMVQNAIKISQVANDEVLKHQVYFLASKVNDALGRTPKAIDFLEIGEKLEMASKDTTELIVTIDEKLRLLNKVGSALAFQEALLEQEKLLIRFPNDQALLSFYQFKADWLAKQGIYKEACPPPISSTSQK